MKIQLNQVGFHYSKDTPFEVRALQHINMLFEANKFYAIIGRTGSGKSTVIQHLNALIKPTEGHIDIDGQKIHYKTKNKHLKPIRKKIGLVFQFAEQQLFEETVLKDIIFGPINYGVAKDEAEKRAHNLVKLFGMDESILNKSPFELSGGQMRRIAIMGVLAMEPDVLILDEPTAGLDPRGQQEIMTFFHQLQKDLGITVVLVTHQMDQAAQADYIYVMHHGTLVDEGMPQEIFNKDLTAYDILPPEITQLQKKFERKYNIKLPHIALTIEDFNHMYQEWRTNHAR
ncbi:energy-coupling factor transporter ATPase [Macrococcoides caseolyticum]|uniref:energy-coupling factor transporter ATPase n=1 Tax=Macrococcoides caseolyticum TaxID=69966 RepID=UPI001F3FEC14|nr:energy-coupling factor transporter ATPase [Macrococcus caseolyticus]MCE4957839.1 energy-coupling factor transporter ATPase [Macrococcus caseolyticus]